MTFRFRRRLRVMPGLWLNLSKSGVSTSIGGRGVTLNLGRKGAMTTVGIPGTGHSWRSRRVPYGGRKKAKETKIGSFATDTVRTGPGEIGMAAILAPALLILALVGLLAIFAR